MKILLGLLLSSLVIASEGTMSVGVRVLDTLTLRVDDHIDFGNVAKGTEYTSTGSYSVKGQSGEVVEVSITGFDENNGSLELTSANGTHSITAVVQNHNKYSMRLEGDDFNKAENIIVCLEVPSDIVSQEYKANLILKVKYQ